VIHIVHSTETADGKCPQCGGETALVVCSDCWDVDEESPFAEDLIDGVQTGLEISGHWCEECGLLACIAINGRLTDSRRLEQENRELRALLYDEVVADPISAVVVAIGEAADLADDPDYQAFVQEQAKYCRCTRGPCDGVLAGGPCDEIIDDEDDDEYDDWEDEEDAEWSTDQ
jgi:hypothetical protein